MATAVDRLWPLSWAFQERPRGRFISSATRWRSRHLLFDVVPAAECALRSTPACAGTTFRCRCVPLSFRSTPACAGTTCRSFHVGGLFSVHPRVRGDNKSSVPANRGCRRCPPRVRGDNSQGRCSRGGFRESTPACAGTTSALKT